MSELKDILNELKKIAMQHENRITRLETKMDSIETQFFSWMKKIDNKLDSMNKDLSYMMGRFNESRKSSKEIRNIEMSWRSTILYFLAAILGGVITLIGNIMVNILR